MELLFVYGTLKDTKVQRKVFGRAANPGKDTLPNYRKSRIKIGRETYPAIISSRWNSIRGLVISVTEKELGQIDKYETKSYRRKKAKLKSGRSAWVYVRN